MDFSARTLSRMLEINFGYNKITNNLFENVIEMPALEAFRYSAITNSPYLSGSYGYSPFGKLITFNHRNFSLNSGLFLLPSKGKNISLFHAPIKLFKEKPFLISGNKKIIFIDTLTSDIEKSLIKKIIENGDNPNDYILTKVKKTGSDLEHFFEFVACKVFSEMGFFCETQIPWSYHGRPDFGAYKSPLFNELFKLGFVANGGFLIDLTTLFIKKEVKTIGRHDKYEIIIGEVKSKNQKTRLSNYLEYDICDYGIEIIPSKSKMSRGLGLLSISKNLKINLNLPSNKLKSNEMVKIKDGVWFETYVKSFLLSNIEEDKLLEFVSEKSVNKKTDSKNFLDLIKKISIDEILNLIEVRDYGL